jgi:membrane protein implicated in regulation of membrane protease activity
LIIAEILVPAIEIYLVMGILFGIAFVTRGVQVIDHAAEGTGWGFRLIILPGVAAFWPVLLWRWIRKAQPPEERNAHRDRTRRGGP